MKHYDVIVVGGGHAGCEAAYAASNMGVSTLLLTLDRNGTGVMSCNPAIGGLGKGHLVREIDALGGLMGLAADQSGIQFRLLNRRKGPAVQGPRCQSDRKLYRQAVQNILATCDKLDIREGEVADLLVEGYVLQGVRLADGSDIKAGAVVLTTGTFLGGTIHIGDKSWSGGRMKEAASIKLAQRLKDMALPLGRLKTGTPPRLDGRTIDWSKLDEQAGDEEPSLFSFMSHAPFARQIACGITHTNPQTHDVIQRNLGRSALYGGAISGVGPRYCPSIEDKVVRFEEKSSHQVFLEPEGLDDHTVYPNGISTSLPEDAQREFVQSIVGLENAEILQPGYAIEYDFVDPRSLNQSLELLAAPNLFLAGQINGTTGYEEAAAQGYVAGVAAASRARDEEGPSFSRRDSYIGVLLDDLTSMGVTEPYRMFTSRAEFRLKLRADNADQRLTEVGRRHGTVSEERWAKFSKKMDQIGLLKEKLGQTKVSAKALAESGVQINESTSHRTALEALALTDVSFETIEDASGVAFSAPVEVKRQIKYDALYSYYVDRQMAEFDHLQKSEAEKISAEIDFTAIPGISAELAKKLQATRPNSIAQAGRIEGMTPAALIRLLSHIKKIAKLSA